MAVANNVGGLEEEKKQGEEEQINTASQAANKVQKKKNC